MISTYKFKPGQRVRLWDGYVDRWHYGEVVDSAKGMVSIRWANRPEPKDYHPGEENRVWEDLELTRKLF